MASVVRCSYEDDHVTQSCNPYNPPREQSPPDSRGATPPNGASVLWFLGPTFVVNLLGIISQPTVYTQPMTLRYVATLFVGMSLLAVVSSLVVTLIYGGANRIFKRSCPATRASRAMAGIVFASIMWIVVSFVVVVRFPGPPGIISIPLGIIASSFVDRYLAKLAHTVTEQERCTRAGGIAEP